MKYVDKTGNTGYIWCLCQAVLVMVVEFILFKLRLGSNSSKFDVLAEMPLKVLE